MRGRYRHKVVSSRNAVEVTKVVALIPPVLTLSDPEVP